MVEITSFIRSFSINFPVAEGTDIAGYIIHACPASEFVEGTLIPSETNKIYQGPDNFYFYTLPEDKLGGMWGIRVAAYDTFGLDELNYSELFTVNVSTLDPLDTVPPSKVCINSHTTGVENNAAVDNTFISVFWKFCDDSQEPLDFSHYVIGWKLQGAATFTEVYSKEAHYTFDGLIAGRTYEFKVRGVDQWVNMGEWSEVLEVVAAADTIPPAAVSNIEITSAIYTIFASWDANTEPDFSEYEVWISENADLTDAVVERTRTTFFTYKGEAGKTYYISVGAVDFSGNHSEFSEIIAVPLNKLDPLDTVPPGVPIWVSATSSIVESGPVDEVCIDLAWTMAEIPHDFSNYVVGYKLSTDTDYIETMTTEPVYKLSGLVAGRTYNIKVRAVDQWLNFSGWSTIKTVEAAKDKTPPPKVTGVTISTAMSTVFLKWNPVTLAGGAPVKDLKQYWVQLATNATFTGATDFYTIGTSFSHNGQTNTKYYARIKAGDYSGNYSTQWSDVVNDTTTKIQTADIDDFAIDASKMFTYVPVIKEASASVWSVNPATETVSWTAHTVVYNGKIFNVQAGSTTFGYIYGTFSGAGGALTYSTLNDAPAPAADRFVMAKNTRGKLEVVWNSQANMVIGSAHIMDAAITNAKIANIHTDKITAGQLDAEFIDTKSINIADLDGTITFKQAGNGTSGITTHINSSGVYTRNIAASQIVIGNDTTAGAGNIGNGGSLTFNDPKIKLDGVNNRISISDAGKERVQIGKVQKVTEDAGAGNSTYGIIISDDSGKPVFRVYEGKAVIENLTGGEINANVVNLSNLHADEITVGQIQASQIDVASIQIADLDGVVSWPQLAGTPAHTYIGANGLYTGTVRAQDVLLGAAAGVGAAGDLVFPNPQVKIEGANARLLIRNNANTQDMVQIGKLGATNYGIQVNNKNGVKVFSVDETGAVIENATVGTLDCSQATLQGLKVGNTASPGYILLDPNATIEWTKVSNTPLHYNQATVPTGTIPAGSTWFNNAAADGGGYTKQTLYIYKGGNWQQASTIGTHIGANGLYTGTITANQIEAGRFGVGTTILSSNYVAGVSGFMISSSAVGPSGYQAEFESIKVRGDVQASSLKADTVMVDRIHVTGHAITDVTSMAYDYTNNPTLPVELDQARPFPSDSFGGVIMVVIVPAGYFPSNATMTYTVNLEGSQTRQSSGSAVAGTETIVVSTSSEVPLGIVQPSLTITMASTNVGVTPTGKKGWYVYITKFILYR